MSGMIQVLELPKRASAPHGVNAARPRPEGGATIHILPCIRREALPDATGVSLRAERA